MVSITLVIYLVLPNNGKDLVWLFHIEQLMKMEYDMYKEIDIFINVTK